MYTLRKFKYNYGAVAGTFSRLHKGHEYLLRKAFSLAKHVVVCITTDNFVRKLNKKHKVENYFIRMSKLIKYFNETNVLERAIFYPLNNIYGPAIIDPKIKVIFVSEETFLRALKVDVVRRNHNLDALDIYVVPLMLAENGKPISSTRIWKGEIDKEGRMIKLK